MAGYAFHPTAEKELSRLPVPDQERVVASLKRVCQEPHPLRDRHVIKLAGYHEPTFRLRVGDWRVLFLLRDDGLHILSVRPRQRGY